ncbi:MAG: PEP/pyruvate-binding domain-containing protein, partial [Nanoarchaeota archaeon]
MDKETKDKKKSLVLWFNEITIEDTPLVGGKNSSLGEMYRELTRKGVNVPNGFAITAAAYKLFVKEAGIEKDVKRILTGLNIKDVEKVAEAGYMVRELIKKAEFPQQLKKEILEAYAKMCKEYRTHVDVAVRSSATLEDLEGASFAGQQESYLNIRGESSLLEACKKCFASLFTNRAIVYRHEKGFDHFKVALSIGVQK